jgi:hypothetical protein
MAKTPKNNTAKNAAAQAMSVLRNQKLTPKRRKEIARQAGIKGAAKRWGKKPQSDETDIELLTALQTAQDAIAQISTLIARKGSDEDTKLAAYVRTNARRIYYALWFASQYVMTPLKDRQIYLEAAKEIVVLTGLTEPPPWSD